MLPIEETEKTLIINSENTSNQEKELSKAIQEYKTTEVLLKEWTKKKEAFKEYIKQFDYGKIIVNGTSGTTILTITQFPQERKTFNKDLFINKLGTDFKSSEIDIIIKKFESSYEVKENKATKITIK